MQLIGMLDSPYVRRTAISLELLGLPFASRPVSVFRQMEAFAAINPVIKAPTLVLEDGTVLMDSHLILLHAEARAGAARSLWPADPAQQPRALRLAGLALAACDKAVQAVYERELRPAEKQHAPWLSRVQAQMHAAWGELQAELQQAPAPGAAGGQPIGQAGICMAVSWHFTQQLLPGMVSEEAFPLPAAFSAQAESLAAFRAWPHAS
ncbi:glutathione S-transferase [Xenophilus arseniciresistens]|uniref:Glutathione S-transferase n=1 Tax=Xenophilus arseniciresistens TaxID=1283306 RepID=A0AAE3NFX9_9BURK|nr:glutathione S-transferase [Xenophilus arseniciresistens]MDA7418934.1 glutathione S-transferase [Xenophilus arseniciresistens]